MPTLRDMLQPMILLILLCLSDGKSPKSSSQSLIVGIVEVLKLCVCGDGGGGADRVYMENLCR